MKNSRIPKGRGKQSLLWQHRYSIKRVRERERDEKVKRVSTEAAKLRRQLYLGASATRWFLKYESSKVLHCHMGYPSFLSGWGLLCGNLIVVSCGINA